MAQKTNKLKNKNKNVIGQLRRLNFVRILKIVSSVFLDPTQSLDSTSGLLTRRVNPCLVCVCWKEQQFVPRGRAHSFLLSVNVTHSPSQVQFPNSSTNSTRSPITPTPESPRHAHFGCGPSLRRHTPFHSFLLT